MDSDRSIDIVVGIGMVALWAVLFWFIQSQIVLIYSQGIPFRVYYNPAQIAFVGATVPVALCSIVYIYRGKVYSFFERLAMDIKERQEESEE